MKDKIPCPAAGCHTVGCYRHCNHCGDDVKWRPDALDREIPYQGPKPINQDGKTVHRCMLGGTKDGKFLHTPKYNNDKNVIDYTRPHIKTMIFNRTQPSDEVIEQAKIKITCPRCNHKTEPYYMKFHIC